MYKVLKEYARVNEENCKESCRYRGEESKAERLSLLLQ